MTLRNKIQEYCLAADGWIHPESEPRKTPPLRLVFRKVHPV